MVRSISGSLRSKIALAKNRLVTAEEKVSQLLDVTFLTKDKSKEVQHIQECELAISKLKVAIDYMKEYDSKWDDLIFRLTNEEEIEAEIELYTQCSKEADDGGYLTVMHEATVSLRLLEDKVERIKNPPKHKPDPTAASSRASLATAAPATNSKSIKLPTMTLPRFGGDPLQWNQFWSVFEAAVGKSDIGNIQKFNYLIQQVDGIAHDAISRMQITDTSYDDAVKLLDSRFKREPIQIRMTLYSELKCISPVANRATDVRKNHDTIERILRQLDTTGATIDQESLSLAIWSKYSEPVMEKIIQRYHVGYGSTPTAIQKAIAQYLSDAELLESLQGDVKPYVKSKSETSNRSEKKPKQYTSPEEEGSVSSALAANDKRGKKQSASTGTFAASEKYKGKSSAPTKTSKPRPPCTFCAGDHFNADCTKFPTATSRKQRLTELGRCTVCFGLSHDASKCHTPPRYLYCYYCKTTVHKSALCPTQFPDPKSTASAGYSSTRALGSCLMGMNDNALLLTAVTQISNPSTGSAKRVRVMLDTGSQRSYVTERLTKELNCNITEDETLHIAVFGSKRTKEVKTGRVELNLALRTSGETSMPLTLNTVPLITECYYGPGKLPEAVRQRIESMDYAMSDDFNPDVGPPDVLIGGDYYFQLLRGGPIKIESSLYLLPTKLGLVLGGSFKTDDKPKLATLLCLTERTAERCITDSLEAISTRSRGYQQDPDIDEFWSLERIGIHDDPTDNEDERALEQFNETVRVNKTNNRYQVCWPWNSQKNRLRSNYQLAAGRLQSLAKRLSTSPKSVVDEYDRVIKYQTAAGIIEQVPEDEALNPKNITHYLPHHPVVRNDHDTTKLRIVYDASAKCGKQSVSLNECMSRGPIILPDLCSLLIRFRLNEVAIVSDIEKAFLQIELQQEERDVTRFLWFRDTKSLDSNNPVVYRFTRVPFGIISSPFMLGATLRHHLNQVDTPVAEQICNNIYVDNVITGTTNTSAAQSFYNEAKEIFNDVSMNLREWCSNSEELMETIKADERSSKRTVKVLGLSWNSQTDQLRLHCDWEKREKCQTKREVLKAIASVYDPLGFFQPCTLNAKSFLRRLWLDKKTWDETIGDGLAREWQHVHSTIKPIFGISLSRCISSPPNSTTTLVVFSDASQEAYATAVYLRSTPPDSNKSTINLIYAKSRLAPNSNYKDSSTISIPKLELLGIVIAAAAAQFVRDSLQSPTPEKVFLLSDSTIALNWLRSKKPLPVFINNRVKKIKQLDNAEFHHVSVSDNPADFLTRGVNGSEIEGCQFWWHGPQWLQLDHKEWPTNINIDAISTEELLEIDKMPHEPVYHSFLAGEDLRGQLHYPLKIAPAMFSSFRRLVRVTAMCVKFINTFLWQKLAEDTKKRYSSLNQLMKTATKGPIITSQELTRSKRVWIKAIQSSGLDDVTRALENGKPHSLTKQLNVYKDDEGLLRCFRRYGYSDLSFESIRPLLLPKNSHLTRIIISDAHQKLFHAGISHTLSQIRREFWIPHGRNTIRKVINQCIVCRKLKGAPFALPGMLPWPRERIARSSPFQFTGVDYLGPINVSVLDTIQKMWVCLFTCLATRAIHLECVEDCTTTSFIECISRFISRRGTPTQIISDNAPQFRLCKTLFDRTWSTVLQDPNVMSYVSDMGIQWKFTTALAPWQGGFYERLVGLVKTTFKSVVGRRLLKREEFITVITEIESIVNSRPLTYVCSNAKSGLALRPIDFLTEQPTGTPMVDDAIRPEGGDAGKLLLRYWKAKQKRLNTLWRQFYDDYLLSLRERYQTKHRNKRCDVHAAPKLDEVVLVKDSDNTPRGTWKLGRITRIIPSRDGEIRSVELKLPNQLKIERSISHLYPLEVQTDALVKPAAPAETGEDEDFHGFDDVDLAEIPQQLQFLDRAAVNASMIRASTRSNVLASLMTSATPLLC